MRRMFSLALIAGLVLAGTACPDKKPTPPVTRLSDGPSSAAPSAVPTGPPGSYSYGSYGLTASLEPTAENIYVLKVTNKTGSSGKPGIYALDARTGKQINSTIDPDSTVPDGQTKDFVVTMGAGFDPEQVGLMIILLGGDNFGAFVANTAA